MTTATLIAVTNNEQLLDQVVEGFLDDNGSDFVGDLLDAKTEEDLIQLGRHYKRMLEERLDERFANLQDYGQVEDHDGDE